MKRLWRWWQRRQWTREGLDVARRLVRAEAIYATRVAIHGGGAYIHARELAEMKGECEVLIFDLERLNDLLGKKP